MAFAVAYSDTNSCGNYNLSIHAGTGTDALEY